MTMFHHKLLIREGGVLMGPMKGIRFGHQYLSGVVKNIQSKKIVLCVGNL